jgi:hypothetical protein
MTLACITCKFIDAALVLFLSITGQFWFCELLLDIGTLKGDSFVSILEYVCDFPYSWAVTCEGCPFLSSGFVLSVGLILVGFCVVFPGLDSVSVFEGSYYFARLIVLKSILFVSASVLMEVSAFW